MSPEDVPQVTVLPHSIYFPQGVSMQMADTSQTYDIFLSAMTMFPSVAKGTSGYAFPQDTLPSWSDEPQAGPSAVDPLMPFDLFLADSGDVEFNQAFYPDCYY